MPNPGAQLEFTAFSDEFIAWENRAALQAFFEDIRVPAATVDNYGSMKMVEENAYANSDLINADTLNLVVDGVAIGEVPTKASFLELKAAFNLLKDSYNSLLVKMRDAGVLDE